MKMGSTLFSFHKYFSINIACVGVQQKVEQAYFLKYVQQYKKYV